MRSLHSLGILDTPPEERFDRITRLAMLALDGRIALISLVDAERQLVQELPGPGRERDRPRRVVLRACDPVRYGVQDWWGDRIRLDGTPMPVDERPLVRTLVTGEAVSGCVVGFPLESGDALWLEVDTQPLTHPGKLRPDAVVVRLWCLDDQRYSSRSRRVATISSSITS